ncbi:MAG: SPFH domain-containing protein [Proteobacteria bacterium]|nr:SPFH domain-containing protein [Pseudomonadota bacterium]MBU1586061.1 SPFH domain-containing protein [Pseudomonadota bacterium]MBU2455643.1 SPFH domain-containing protein [Pseudomonadota bacterium]MBU2629759.1 SPFH domain-containing protein [Pseudomonadota bacterium]
MGHQNIVFLEILEWFDKTGQEILQRLPEEGSGEIKYGAQIIVRENQAGVFFYNGKAIHVFGPGRYTLKTGNIPILNKILSIPWGLSSPLRAEAYFINMKVFPDLKWGTRDPVAFKDSELGLIRLRAFGMFNIRIIQPLLFINSLIGTMARFTTADIEAYLGKVIVSRFNDYMGDNLDTILDLPGKYEAWAEGLQKSLTDEFSRFGLCLADLFITSITPPQEVQKLMDDRSALGLFDDMNKLMQLKAAAAMEKAAENPGMAGQGMGMGLGFMVPSMVSKITEAAAAVESSSGESRPKCPDCEQAIPHDAGFCPFCGHQIMVIEQCISCGKNLSVSTRFCPKCGTRVEKKKPEKVCQACGANNLMNSNYCNNCGEHT